MNFETAAEEIDYLLKRIIFVYVKNSTTTKIQLCHSTTTKIQLCHNGTDDSINKILIRYGSKVFIDQYIKELFPMECIHKGIHKYSGWYLIEFGVRVKDLEGLKPMTAYEAINLLNENPIRFFATFDLYLLSFWLPMGIISYMGVDHVDDEEKIKKLIQNARWEWTKDVYGPTREEFTLKILKAFVHSLSLVEECGDLDKLYIEEK